MLLLTCTVHSKPCGNPSQQQDVAQVLQPLINKFMQELVAGSSAFVTRPRMELFADFCRDEILHGLPEGVHTPLRAAVVGIQRLPAGSLTGSAGAQHAQARMLVVKVAPNASAGESCSMDKQHCKDTRNAAEPHCAGCFEDILRSRTRHVRHSMGARRSMHMLALCYPAQVKAAACCWTASIACRRVRWPIVLIAAPRSCPHGRSPSWAPGLWNPGTAPHRRSLLQMAAMLTQVQRLQTPS